MGRREKSADPGKATPAGKAAAPKSGMVIEGREAVDLYVKQIARNLTELEKQVVRLQEACAETRKSLRDAE